jgi:uncharacterized protein YqeY
MSIVEDVNAAIVRSMRDRQAARLSALRMLKSALTNKSVEKGRDLDDGEARQVVAGLVKQRKDSIDQFTKGGRLDLAAREAGEITVLEEYLPPAVDPAFIERVIDEVIIETGAASPKDLGRVMKTAMARLAGQTMDGKVVNELARTKLADIGRAKGVE